PMPRGAERVVLQEDVTRNGDQIVLGERIEQGTNVRPAGADFPAGFTLRAPRRLGPSDLALLAAMNCAQVLVSRRPVVAIIATGDELVMPGESLRDDQIVASNCFALKAMVQSVGAEARLLPIAPDRPEALRATLELASDADLIVTIGGASVGDHDLVAQVAGDLGLERAFYKIAMRPGKPLMAGRLGNAVFLGLPGNPVSAIVCGHLFLLPMLRATLGLDQVAPIERSARLSAPLPANGPRAHYMRAVVEHGPDGDVVTAFDRQDSSLLTILTEANCLLVCPPNAPPLAAGQSVTILPLQAHY
ncbi:MAG: molybdopterin molybdenumtransferase MoeA, partial [Rhodobacteraceae bacterium]|nr:molybdopterin molybdenumtransferase MoeA [Paracoccaceae bacterium]